MAAVDRLSRDVVHEICTNQVVVTLHACVKELVENSLDASASRIEVRLRENGSELLEVVDDGCGISADNFAKLATRHATSKIRGYDDISKSLSTFGFRGEALAAICAMGEVTVCTRTANDATATLLAYDRFGKLVSESPAAREVGTTVSVRELFGRLPVRHREFLRNAKSQVNATLRLMQSYAIAEPEIRFHVVAEKVRGQGAGRATLLSTSGTARGWRESAAAVLGDAVISDVVPLDISSEETGWSITGLVSTPNGGRRSRDSQLFFVNRRPIDPPKRVAKLINDTYHQYNSKMWPVTILSFTASQSLVDVNVTPDKRSVFLHNEEALLADFQKRLTELYSPASGASDRGSEGLSLSAFGIKGAAVGAPKALDAEAVTPPSSATGSATGSFPTKKNGSGHGSGRCGAQDATLFDSTIDVSENALVAALPSGGSSDFEFETPPRQPAGAASGTEPGSKLAKLPKVSKEKLAVDPMASEGSSVTESAPESIVVQESGDLQFEVFHPTTDHESNKAAGNAATSDLLVEEYIPPTDNSVSATTQPGDGFRLVEFQPESTSGVQIVSAEDGPGGFEGSSGQSVDLGVLADIPANADVDGALVAQHSDVALVPLPVAGPIVTVSIGLACLEAAVRRRQRRHSARQDASELIESPQVAFPSAFSLSSLRPGAGVSSGTSRSSLEEVAKFATDVGPMADGSNVDGDNSKARQQVDTSFRFDQSCFLQMRVIGQFNLGFVITALRTTKRIGDCADTTGASSQPGSLGAAGLQLFIIDQHASDEKFRFEALNRESKVDRQPLVTPLAVQLTPAQEQLAAAHLELFRLNGFGVSFDDDRPQGRRLHLTALPTCKGLVFGERDVQDLLYTIQEAESQQSQPSLKETGGSGLLDMAGHRALWSSTTVARPKKIWQLLACRACRGAIMIGKALRISEMEKILANLSSLQQPWNCPHGRPTMRHLIDAGSAWCTPPRRGSLAIVLGESQENQKSVEPLPSTI
eukprot:TRINITY_DN73834_c0_g1_i1.p1 TRINITY_DN73834_c0_g1~~TRINITY_DN73834_c0_g1_i1.p1  ORF type:complete len:988 (-),score=153.27 TRINITY_DN73834_c0_g1_i1:326-3289(-)